MPEIPECLNRRYKALDELIRELSSYQPENTNMISSSTDDPGIKLMCDFWNILKEDPDINLTQAVQQRMGVKHGSSGLFGHHGIGCYMAGCCKKNEDKKEEANKAKKICCKSSNDSTGAKPDGKCCQSKSPSSSTSDALPLNKVLCNLKQAASFEKKCQAKVSELTEAQQQLQDQIQVLEQREKEGVQLLKQADCMWSCMEESYKKKIAESLKRQQGLLKELKDVEASNTKWRKNKKDLESQLDSIDKCHREISEKINQKSNDVKCIDREITTFKNRIESNKKDLENAKKSLNSKKQASDFKITKIAAEVTKLEMALKDEQKHKYEKEQEGKKYVKEAREDLQKLCKILIQKKLENEDMIAEKEALILEIELLTQNCDQCKDRCKNKQESINDEIKSIEKELAEFKVRCIRCHECTDTVDVRKFCTDCPRCVNERQCLYEGDHCSPDHAMDCVCTTVKQNFLDNVFDNMYTVLERQIKTGPGKAIAEEVMNCLKKSRNGKLNDATRKILQEFILTTVKKNLNLTIVGGAVKTRCEMDADTYNQLMLCLKQVKVTKPQKVDQGTDSKKDPCRRWGGTSECHCPKGPKDCICTKKAPPPPKDLAPCPPPDKEDLGDVITCPHRESTSCGPDCAMHAVPSRVGSEIASWKPNPCQGPTCNFKNMRAAQCVLGPEPLSSVSTSKGFKINAPYVPSSMLEEEDQVSCKCGASETVPCVCLDDVCSRPRDRIIEEVMGRYTEVSPIEKVSTLNEQNMGIMNKGGKIKDEFVFKRNKKKQNKINSFKESNAPTCTHSCKERLRDINIRLYKDNDFTDLCTCSKSITRQNTLRKLVTQKSILSNNNTNSLSPMTNNTYYKVDTRICDRVSDLMREVIVYDNQPTDDISGEWISLSSLIQKVTVMTKVNDENIIKDQERQDESIFTKNISKCDNDNMEKPDLGTIYRNISYKSNLSTQSLFYLLTKQNVKNKKQLKAECSKPCKAKKSQIIWNSDKEKLDENNKNIKLKDILANQENLDTINNDIKVVLKHNKRYVKNRIPKLSKTSEEISIALNENIIKSVEEKMKNGSNLNLVLKNTNSGHILADFSSAISGSDGSKSFMIQKTSSGNIVLDVDGKCKNKPTINVTCSQNTSLQIDENIIDISVKDSPFGTSLNSINSDAKAMKKSNKITNEQTYLNNTCKKSKSISAKEKSFTKTESKISKHKSKIKDYLGNCYKEKELVSQDDLTKFLLKTSSKNTDSKCKSINNTESPDGIYKLKVKGFNSILQDPKIAVKRSAYGKYDMILDKEFEKWFKETIKNHEGDDAEYYVKLKKTQSDFIIDFNKENDDEPNSMKAFIIKSESGTIKVIVDGPDPETSSIKRDSITSKSIMSRRTINNLLSKKNASSKKSCIDNVRKSQIATRKSSSDSNIYDRVRFSLQNNKTLLDESSPVLKKTSSGQYIVVLNKESKKAFISNLENYLCSGSKAIVPIKQTDSGIIVIDLNNSKDNNNQYGSLKITPSGNIYVTVNESAFQSAKTKEFKDFAYKASATTCKPKCSGNFCDGTKCVCRYMSIDGSKAELDNYIEAESFSNSQSRTPEIYERTSMSNVGNLYSTSKNKTPHIVIKPCGCHPTMEKPSDEYCYSVVQSVCPYHINRYEDLSNEILEISGLCNVVHTKSKDLVKETRNKSLNESFKDNKSCFSWDSLEYLPPQLPPFLKDFTFTTN